MSPPKPELTPAEADTAHDHHFDATQQHELPEFIDQLSQEFRGHSPAELAAAVQVCRTTAAPSYGRGALRECVRQVLTEGRPAQV
ncbi:MAG: hypothetical protein EOP86_19540 [Verrucomicrobiaceae bacterium]|nr:MAG: hypothetical protein EOP86_19540 [Verrucomicrobiaceae bacterium]